MDSMTDEAWALLATLHRANQGGRRPPTIGPGVPALRYAELLGNCLIERYRGVWIVVAAGEAALSERHAGPR